jgi:predicted  nucleic acid-binding Zn-ribbon protein
MPHSPPECCRECGEPFNDADAPGSGLCAACGADDYCAAEDILIAERDQLRDWEHERGIDR